jgi:signal transduction histidine kinase
MKIVEAHRGRIEVLANQERGVTFRIEIPASYTP